MTTQTTSTTATLNRNQAEALLDAANPWQTPNEREADIRRAMTRTPRDAVSWACAQFSVPVSGTLQRVRDAVGL